jgi:N-acetyl-anhydromuramyl-L-alanine amidase AmpD
MARRRRETPREMETAIGTTPLFVDGGIPIYWIDGVVHYDARPTPGDIRVIVAHHTGGSDSRLYLRKPNDGRKVSTHYLAGAYADTGWQARMYKYMTEGSKRAWTQGGGWLGGHPGNPNSYCVSVEIEGPPFRDDVLALAAKMTRVILNRYPNALLIRHLDMDDAKHDPAFPWLPFCQMVYS